MLTFIRSLSTSFLFAVILPAAPLLYTIGENSNGTPNQLIQIDVANSTTHTVTTIGNVTQSFGGGLYTNDGFAFATFQNPGNGQTLFTVFDVLGNSGTLGTAPAFRGGGIVVPPPNQNIFWLQTDAQGVSKVAFNGTPAATVGDNLVGGLAFRYTDQLLYTIRTDAQGASTFRYIDSNTLSTVTLGINLGSGFTGGLTWDEVDDLFYAIGSDAANNATLYRFAVGDAAPTALFGLGKGFTYASLTTVPGAATDPAPTTNTPEPGTYLMLGAGLLVIGLIGRHK